MTPTGMNVGLRCGLIERKHYLQMGDALWLYLWFVARQTKQKHGEGLVLGGKPLTYLEIQDETGFPARTVEKWTARLRLNGYVNVKHSSYKKLVVSVTKAKKFPDQQISLIPPASGIQITPAGGILPASQRDSRTDRKEERQTTKTPLPPASGGTQSFVVWGQTVLVEMGRKHRLPNLAHLSGGRADEYAEYLTRHGFPARIVEGVA